MRVPGRQQRGVTLLELMAALAAVLVLCSLAIPGFNGYVERTRVARAISDIGTLSIHLYRWQLNTRTFPLTLADAGLGGNDPWGRPYRYVRVEGARTGDLRKDRNLHPINTDFDLYSMGPDGRSAGPLTARDSRDDIVRANDGTFIDIAGKY